MIQIIILLGILLLMFLMITSFRGKATEDDPLSDFIPKKNKC
ncbi:MAG: hypothetical protein U5N85_16800 [Arcicella sp.]|nr:hypothetical protein [Arcicella sp.]